MQKHLNSCLDGGAKLSSQPMAKMPEDPVVMQMLQFHKLCIIKNCLTPAVEVNVRQTFFCGFVSNSRE